MLSTNVLSKDHDHKAAGETEEEGHAHGKTVSNAAQARLDAEKLKVKT